MRCTQARLEEIRSRQLPSRGVLVRDCGEGFLGGDVFVDVTNDDLDFSIRERFVHDAYQPIEQGRHVVSVSFYNERWTDHTLAFGSVWSVMNGDQTTSRATPGGAILDNMTSILAQTEALGEGIGGRTGWHLTYSE